MIHEKPFYVTTPIYYVNDKPHIGHAYSTIAADVLHRYHRLRGRKTRFLTGTDEHGLKLERAAQEQGIDPQEFVDRMAPPFRKTFESLSCEFDDFIRTTQTRHKEKAQYLWKKLEDAGDIYLGEYSGWYCVPCEAYYTDKDLDEEKSCPIHKKPIERVSEKSFFFRLSNFTDKLLDFFDKNPTFVQPEGRFNEVKQFVREGLRDISVSRTSFRWGVPVPDHPEHVMYVWLDALENYLSALGGPAEKGESDKFDTFWPPHAHALHIVGKDILRFHAIYWPAFLLSAGIEPPSQIWAHGWLTVNGEKMSKTAGNFLPPEPIAESFGTDVLRYYLMRDVGFGQDGDFSHDNLFARYQGELGNGLGNLLNRMISSIVKKNCDGKIPAFDENDLDSNDKELIEACRKAAKNAAIHLEQVAPHKALEAIYELITETNRYVDLTAPWSLAKEANESAEKKKRLHQVVYCTLEALRWLSIVLSPFMPDRCNALRKQLGIGPLFPTVGKDYWPEIWGGLTPHTTTSPGEALFPRFDKDQEQAIRERLGIAKPSLPKNKPQTSGQQSPKDKKMETDSEFVEFEDVMKVDIRVGLILTAEVVPKSKKLLRLEVDLGEEKPRQILAGISLHYKPEELTGKSVAIIANLKPRKLMGLESQGMVLAAGDGDSLSVLNPERTMPPGSKIK